jgi:hypothetical protein
VHTCASPSIASSLAAVSASCCAHEEGRRVWQRDEAICRCDEANNAGWDARGGRAHLRRRLAAPIHPINRQLARGLVRFLLHPWGGGQWVGACVVATKPSAGVTKPTMRGTREGRGHLPRRLAGIHPIHRQLARRRVRFSLRARVGQVGVAARRSPPTV